MFAAKGKFRMTAWHMAAQNGELEILHKVWKWAKKVLTPE